MAVRQYRIGRDVEMSPEDMTRGPEARTRESDIDPDGADRTHHRVFDLVGGMPGHLLRRCQQIAVSIFLQECREFELTPLQFAVLAALSQSDPVDQVHLGGLAALDRTTISVVVRNLERRGLAHREVSDRDRRSKLIHATQDGRDLLARAMSAVETAQQRIVAPLSPREQRSLIATLEKLADGNNEHSRAPLRD
jgi:DNA-binding MarR family transcriptional regulator